MQVSRLHLEKAATHMAEYVTAMSSIPEFDLDADQEQFEGAVAHEMFTNLAPTTIQTLDPLNKGKAMVALLRGFASPLLSTFPPIMSNTELPPSYEFFTRGFARLFNHRLCTQSGEFFHGETRFHFDNQSLQFHLTTNGCSVAMFVDANTSLSERQRRLLSSPVFTRWEDIAEEKDGGPDFFPLVIIHEDTAYLWGPFNSRTKNDIHIGKKAAHRLGIDAGDIKGAIEELDETLYKIKKPSSMQKIGITKGDILVWKEGTHEHTQFDRYGRIMHGFSSLPAMGYRTSHVFILMHGDFKCFSDSTLQDVNRRIYARMKEIELPGEERGR